MVKNIKHLNSCSSSIEWECFHLIEPQNVPNVVLLSEFDETRLPSTVDGKTQDPHQTPPNGSTFNDALKFKVDVDNNGIYGFCKAILELGMR